MLTQNIKNVVYSDPQNIIKKTADLISVKIKNMYGIQKTKIIEIVMRKIIGNIEILILE